MAARFRAFVLAGTGSGCGKTTVTLGLLTLLKQRGLRVQPCKSGPDYLDTAWHTAISGTPSCNLDSFMLPAPVLNTLFAEHMQQVDIAVIEGAMGLYDGYGSNPDYCSTASLAKQLGCPVVLLVDGKAVSTSIVATVMGFVHFDPNLTIAGVIVNRVNSESHFQLLKHAIEHYCHIPVLGYVPRVEGIGLPERPDTQAGAGLTLALADDEAFNFYYPDNITLLERCGVEIVRFSPLHDSSLPACQMVWLGGGYPELHAAALAANTSMLAQLRATHARGVAIYAECGGLMYLGTTLEDVHGETYRMANIIPGHSTTGHRLTRFGHCEAQVTSPTLLAAVDETLYGHEFHYSDFTTDVPPVMACRKARDGKTIQAWSGGWQAGSAFASYLHVHFAQRPLMLNRWLTLARSAS